MYVCMYVCIFICIYMQTDEGSCRATCIVASARCVSVCVYREREREREREMQTDEEFMQSYVSWHPGVCVCVCVAQCRDILSHCTHTNCMHMYVQSYMVHVLWRGKGIYTQRDRERQRESACIYRWIVAPSKSQIMHISVECLQYRCM
jgi:hypothetical protein